ncbi:uncharacterized protein PG998_003034 [Apiospora kogelbergensis]|uniref:uncharacterized protein n=1 Tax=Apiospora kogelbergensis TaxID=1337665 RepID=UPI00312EFE02
MFIKSAFAILSGVATLALGGVLVHPDDPYASLAVTASSYEDWVNRIIEAVAKADSSGPGPSPSPLASVAQQEAVEDLVNATLSAHSTTLAARQSRVLCDINTPCFPLELTRYLANLSSIQAPDAGRCVSHLASLGTQECRVGTSGTEMCRDHNARVVGLSISGERANSCNNVARAGGRILDLCTKSDNQVTGQSTLDSDNSFNVIISA